MGRLASGERHSPLTDVFSTRSDVEAKLKSNLSGAISNLTEDQMKVLLKAIEADNKPAAALLRAEWLKAKGQPIGS